MEGLGLMIAAEPGIWIHLFSSDPDVAGRAQTYMRIVTPAYGLMAIGFVVTFAAQGAGHVLWPFIAGTMRMLVAAGLSWFAVQQFNAGIGVIALIVVASLAAYASISLIAMASPNVWRADRASKSKTAK